MKRFGKIIIPEGTSLNPYRGLSRKERKARKKYFTNPEVKALADKIHHHRMMPGPACIQCMMIAVNKLAKQL